MAPYHSRRSFPALPRVRTPTHEQRCERVDQRAPRRRGGHPAWHEPQQAPERRAIAEVDLGDEGPGATAQRPGRARHLDLDDLDPVELVGRRDERRHLLARSEQRAHTVGGFGHHVGEAAEGRRRPVADHHAAPRRSAEPGDLAAEALSHQPSSGDATVARLAAATSRDASRPKITAWKGNREYQYRRPHRPLGANSAALLQPVRSVVVRADPPLEPGVARQAHLCTQSHESLRFDRLDPPEVERVTDPELIGVTSTPSHPDAADGLVDPTPRRPQQRGHVPASGPSDARDRSEQRLRSHVGLDRLLVDEQQTTRPLGVGGQRVRRGAAWQRGVRPPRRDLQAGRSLECEARRPRRTPCCPRARGTAPAGCGSRRRPSPGSRPAAGRGRPAAASPG